LPELEAEYQRPDHWNYKTDPYEIRKYEQTLRLIPPRRYARALEIGCSEGVFTRRLAALADAVLGVDLVPLALERARVECAGLQHVQFRQFDLGRDTLQERFDLIVCAEVLYYLRWTQLRPVTRKIIGWLRPGGCLVAVHPTSDVVAEWGFGPKGADRTHPLFQRAGMRRIREQHEQGEVAGQAVQYVLSLYEKVAEVHVPRWRQVVEDLRGLAYPAVAMAVLRRRLGGWLG
jgi:SAM-dependent methyltransferase